MTRYKHTQIGYVMIVSLGGGLALIAGLLLVDGFNWIGLAVALLLAASLVVFATLTVEIGPERLGVRFGPGLLRKHFKLKDIESCRAVRNAWYYGWGIRLMPHGWLYNVSGLSAVELHLKNGDRYRIGTDQPQALVRALEQAIAEVGE